MILIIACCRSMEMDLRLLFEWTLFNHNRAGLVPPGNAICLLDAKIAPAADPIERLLQDTNRQVTDRPLGLPAPAYRTAIDVPQNLAPGILDVYPLVRIVIKNISEQARAQQDFFI